MLVLLPAYHARNNGLHELKLRVDYLKELGAVNRGAFFNHGFVFECPDHVYDEWQDILGIVPFN